MVTAETPPSRPHPNGNEMENYVSEMVERIFHRQQRSRVNLYLNLITIGTVLVGIVMAYAGVKGKTDGIQTPVERRAEIREEIAASDSTLAYRVGQVEAAVKTTGTKVDALDDKLDGIDRKISRALEKR